MSIGGHPLFECVPNFSEGRRPEVLMALRKAAQVPDVAILGLEGDPDHNRAVMTLVGPAEPLSEAVFRTMRVALESIDLNKHEGTHPRIGAADVVPFVPWRQASMDEAIGLAHGLGRRVGDELGLPVFFYGKAALSPSRVNLFDVRRGEFEGLSQRLSLELPDCGPRTPHATAGAVAIGARNVLIAFNVFLETQNLSIAKKVARAVRGTSGGLVGVRALAMDTKSRGRVQVSMNLIDYRTTSLPHALEMVRREAARFGVSVAETEVVGLMPYLAVEDAVRYYLQMPGFDRQRVLETAIGDAQNFKGSSGGWE